MVETLLDRISSATTLEEEIAEEERLALSEQAEADRLQARTAELANHARNRLAAVAIARAALAGDPLPIVARHEEPSCFESLPDWP